MSGPGGRAGRGGPGPQGGRVRRPGGAVLGRRVGRRVGRAFWSRTPGGPLPSHCLRPLGWCLLRRGDPGTCCRGSDPSPSSGRLRPRRFEASVMGTRGWCSGTVPLSLKRTRTRSLRDPSRGDPALSSQGSPAAQRHLLLITSRMSREGCSLSCVAK